jgi:Fur family peroxide stress response transcriptional regulator
MQRIVTAQLITELKDAGVRPSTARVSVLRYLQGERNHPTADRIYNDLLPALPGLSRTSVYNTLNTLMAAGLARPLTTDGTEMRYDATIEDHGHFKCDDCGAVYDIDVDMTCVRAKGLKGFDVRRRDVILRGSCPECSKKIRAKGN